MLFGIVMMWIDGDGRGGVVLSMCVVMGCFIKFMGIGEKMDVLEVFYVEWIVNWIFGMGDVVFFVEKVVEIFD